MTASSAISDDLAGLADLLDEDPPVPATTMPGEDPTMPGPSGDFLLPGTGQPLKLTRSREGLMLQYFHRDGVYTGPTTDREVLFLLWLCTHEPADWQARGPDGDGGIKPLYARPYDLFAAVDAWADEVLPTGQAPQQMLLALRLWIHHHSTQVEVDLPDAPGGKKN